MKKPLPHKKPKHHKKPVHHRKPVHPYHGLQPGGVMTPAPARPAPKKPGALAKPAPKPAPHPHRGLQPGGVMKKPRALSDGVPCVAAAVAACLGIPAADVLPFCSGDPDGDLIGDVLEALGIRCRPVESLDVPGLILGLALPEGDHAALSAGDGLMWSWGQLMPVYGNIEEAWAVT